MKYFLFVIVTAFAALALAAQDCTVASLPGKPGIWKAGMKGSEGGTAAELLKEKKIVAAIDSMIKSSYTPMGVEANFHGAYFPPYPHMPGNAYSYSVIPLNYYCDGSSIKTSRETSTYFEISVNINGDAIYDTAQGDRLLLEGFNVIYDKPQQKNGYWFVKEKDVTLAFGIRGKAWKWLVTYNGQLPYAYVTKKEFLEKRKDILYNLMLQSTAEIKDVLDRKEIEKKYKEAEYKNDPKKLQHYMKMDYLNIKERYEKLLGENEQNHKSAIDKIETLLKMPSSQLNELAIVKIDPHDHLSYLFTDDNDPFRLILIKPNPGYFKKLPRSSPQFFSIYLTGDPNDPITSKVLAGLTNAINFQTFINMLGK